MKDNLLRLILISFDILAIYTSILLAYLLRVLFDGYFAAPVIGDITHYTYEFIVYIVVVMTFISIGIYKHRHDFWEETYLILKSLTLSLILLLSVLALSKSMGNYSRFILITSFVFMALLIPVVKFILKKKLSVFGIWNRNAEVISSDSNITDEIFGNKYLGYVKSSHKNSDIVFMDTQGIPKEEIESKLLSLSYE
ncbi:MAG: hypothetical protein U9Q40_08730, partial [Campylobacterota bacterium]|nr:hypothetical protein [Campylobacterota bacterium]